MLLKYLLLLFGYVSAMVLEPILEPSIVLNSNGKVKLASTELSVPHPLVEASIILNSSKSSIHEEASVILNSNTSENFCGLKSDQIKNYLEPPQEVKEFLSVGFGISFDIGPLGDSDSESCETLGNMIGDVEMAWINVDHGEVTKFVSDTIVTRDSNYKKCIARGEEEEKCKNEEKMSTPKASYAQKYNNLPFPICMAVRPCDKNNGKLFREFTFGVRFGGDGVPIFTLYAVTFNLIQLAFSSTGHLTTSQWDEDLPPLLDVVKHESWGMHVFLEAAFTIPLCTIGEEEILTAEVNAGLGVFAMMKLRNGDEIRSAAEFFGYFIDTGGNLDELAEKFRNSDSSIKSVNFEVNGMLDGELSINLNAIFGTKNLENLGVDVKARTVIQVHLEEGNSMLQFWNSFQADTNLKDALKIAPILADIVPSIDLSVLMRIYTGIKESGEVDFVGAFKATVQLSCGPLRDVLEIWKNLVDHIKNTFKGTPLDPLLEMISLVTNFLVKVCDNGLSIGFQIRVNNGLVPYDTFLEFQESKLRLSDLPICDAGSLGIPASPYPREQAHDHPHSRCSTNDDCWRDDDSYRIGIYDGNRGYCLNHPNLFTVAGCLGRCIKKLPPGANCNKDKMNIFPLLQIDPTNAEHAACQSGQCTCGVCTDLDEKVPNGGKCNGAGDCESGWCEGDVVIGCNGICRPKRRNGQPSWKDWQASCESGRSQCGTCTANYKDLANGKACSGAAQCASGWCEGDVVVDCRGICRAKRRNGQPSWKDWQASCESGRSQCGTCTANYRDLANGKACSGYAQCASGWCEGHVVHDCRGRCQAKRRNGQSAWHGWSRSCLSGREQCGTCTANYRDLANGKACSGYAQCASGWCEGHVVTSCRGRCQAKRHNGQSAWHAWSRSCYSGREQCGVCTSGSRDLRRGQRCSKSNNCASNYCGCSGWFCTVWNCGGKCR